MIPAKANAKEREMKYHFVPIQSIFGSWKSSMDCFQTSLLELTPQTGGMFPDFPSGYLETNDGRRGRPPCHTDLAIPVEQDHGYAFFRTQTKYSKPHPFRAGRGCNRRSLSRRKPT